MKSLLNIMVLSFGLMVANAAQSSLVDRGGGLIYDTDLDITWLSNANVNGGMTWNTAMTWASNFSYYDSVRNVTYTDWRLPASDSCSGYNCTGGEMGHLFYNELGGKAGFSILSSTDPDLALFTNVQSYFYWSATECGPDPNDACNFDFLDGSQSASFMGNHHIAWAVRPGDVATVPLLAAVWLFGSGLLGLVGIARRQAGSRAP